MRRGPRQRGRRRLAGPTLRPPGWPAYPGRRPLAHPVTVEDQVVDLPDAGLPAVPDVDGTTLTRMGRGALQVHVDVGSGLRLIT